jgi:large subunit ribosomal protein L6
MSRIGKKIIEIPAGVTVEVKGDMIKVSGPKGKLDMNNSSDIEVKVDTDAKQVAVSNSKPEDRNLKAMHGTVRALINNMVVGVSKGFTIPMQIFGTGYNIKEQGGKVILQVGYCHPVELKMPEGLSIEIKTPATRGNDVPAVFTLLSNDKHMLGQFAANVRKVRPPEPYKGKGIRYTDEVVRRKVGKAFASGA